MTLYISDTSWLLQPFKTAWNYLLISVGCMVFGFVYELFSHQVYSNFMVYAFAIPLIGGTLVYLALGLLQRVTYPCTVARYLYHSGLAALTTGSIVRGILDIYGTTNSLIKWYTIVGFSLLIASFFVNAFYVITKD